MKQIDAIIDKYNLDELTKEELELFYLSLEINMELRKSFLFYLKMKYYLIDENVKKVKEFMQSNRLM